MSYCINPACPRPQNPNSNRFCHSCGLDLSQSPLFRERYKVISVLGQGTFGRTYLAHDLDCMERPCVIKKFIAQVQGAALTKAKELFTQEAKRLYELEHPQIPRLYAYFEQEDSLYLVQQFIEGEDLLKVLKKQGNFSEQDIRKLLIDLLSVVQYIHKNQLLHRDIKPENIMRRTSLKGTGQLVLIDFGGAKQTSGTILATPGTAIYTPGYAAIEHMMGKPLKASDLYSLGATCIRLMTGCLPFQGQNGEIVDELYDSGNGSWQWREYLQQQGTTISESLGRVIDKLLQPFAQNRYQSAEEVLLDLQVKSVKRPPSKPLSSNVPSTVSSPTLVVPNSGQQGGENLKSFTFEIITITVQEKLGFFRNQKILQTQRSQGQAKYFTVDLSKGISLDMVYIPGGRFLMGSPEDEKGRYSDESPQHWVTVSPFFMSKYPVTQAQWKAVSYLPQVKGKLKPNPSYFSGNNRPVERVSWNDAVEFCERLSRYTREEYSLPSEAQWEYACRAGTTTPFHYGETITSDLANYRANCTYASEAKGVYREKTTEVGSFPPNAFGLYDMHGNVWEWCLDDWHSNYQGAPSDGSAWLNENENDYHIKLVRGGSWVVNPADCRSASRGDLTRGFGYHFVGFRVVWEVPRTLSP